MIIWISRIMIPLTVCYIISFGLISRRPVFEDFLTGAKKGIQTVMDIFPTLIGLMTAVGVLRASGFLDVLSVWISGPARFFHIPVELVPVTLVRLISNSAAIGLLLDIFEQHGPDSQIGLTASVMLSSTETVFYCLSIYFGAIHITKTRYIIPGALAATAAGIIAAVILCL